MEESSTYQGLIARGRRVAIRETIRELMGTRFGPIPPELDARLESLNDLDQLKRMRKMILTAASWEELFGISRPGSE